MRGIILVTIGIIFSLSTQAQTMVGFVDGFGFLSDSGIRGIPYDQQVAHLKSLAEQFPMKAKYIEYGSSELGRPLAGILLGDFSTQKEAKGLVLVTGATHGNEYLNIADRLPEAFLTQESLGLDALLEAGGQVFIVPILNPDGYTFRRRGNKNHEDLNRDWPLDKTNTEGLTQSETQALAVQVDELVKQNQNRMLMALDYHCCVSGMLLIPWGFKRGEYMPLVDQNRLQPVSDKMLEVFEDPGQVGTPPDLLYSANGTTLDYWYETYGAISMTYEGRWQEEKEYLPEHLDWLDWSFGYLSDSVL